jgi:predicted tellurium resistance membrane protein TerC
MDGQLVMSLLTLTALEIVLGLDNLIFIAILAQKLPENLRGKARNLGLTLALLVRISMLFMVGWIASLTQPLFHFMEHDWTGKHLLLLAGGLFLLYKATKEIHHKMEGAPEDAPQAKAATTFRSVIIQILLIDVVFSVDSVITAVGMAQSVAVMVAANVIALAVMLLTGSAIAGFVDKHPSIKILALSFLVMIGFVLTAEGFGAHISKGYVYFAMAFSVAVELVNIRSNSRKKPVTLLDSPRLP